MTAETLAHQSLTTLDPFPRVERLRAAMLAEERVVSADQARITTRSYAEHDEEPVIVKRAQALAAALRELPIAITPGELIVGNRTPTVRAGVITPEAGASWINKEIETLPTRPQDTFQVDGETIRVFREEVFPQWEGVSLEDVIRQRYGAEIDAIAKVVKINQKDHAQGHIAPNVVAWLAKGPAGLAQEAALRGAAATGEQADFYRAVEITMAGVQDFLQRYADLAERLAANAEPADAADLREVAAIARRLAFHPAGTFHEAIQSLWMLFVVLHTESNASSFSPGRLDVALQPYYETGIADGSLSPERALELIECLFLKFNQIVYLRNAHSARYFAGFPIGFNIAVGGQDAHGGDVANDLSFLFLQAQKHLGLPQPNLSVRLHPGTDDALLKQAVRVVARGSGMPQFFNDASVVPALEAVGVTHTDALDYAIVGCVELTTQGNNLGWSDAAMFNLNKALELTLTGGVDLLTGERIGPDFGSLTDYETWDQLNRAFARTIDHYIDKMIAACEVVERAHMDVLPTGFLSAVIDDCLANGTDVTAGGAKYNLSGIQMIQVASLADSLAALKKLVFDDETISRETMLAALKADFEGYEIEQALLLNKAPKYGNDIAYVDELGEQWAGYFASRLANYTNVRGGRYHTGMYTVSAHVPMGQNVGASPDGRKAATPLADGGLSPVYGRDMAGPTAVLQSVSRMSNEYTSNGGLLNLKFLPEFFDTETNVDKFAQFLRAFVDLEVPHVQFNVVRREDLIAAKANPEQYRSLTIRVAGYTAYFTELSGDLQDEIIARTTHDM
ncbi:MAG TPA: formate C-acetyltransferase/glycerol dehydratase family glycyl radical enzyme [Arachnia sp.]|jgi:formate C-acetyltransferase|nr:formate C-acetyltransferase/glycerol dehydratase family glycyl radical enzyme [Arachnia sp.]HMR12414.1 formate C-acetyltransferase/glycerol dehydratase family glycyl radical enzyme [Arachnia sp.]